MESSTPSRHLRKLELSGLGLVSGDLLYVADFAIPRYGDMIEDLFLEADLKHFVKAELHLSGIPRSVVTADSVNYFDNRLRFFESDHLNLPVAAAPFTPFTVRIFYDHNAVEHAKVYALSLYYTVRPESDDKRVDYIDEHHSPTKTKTTLVTQNGVFECSVVDTMPMKFFLSHTSHRSLLSTTYRFKLPHIGRMCNLKYTGLTSAARATLLMYPTKVVIATISLSVPQGNIVFWNEAAPDVPYTVYIQPAIFYEFVVELTCKDTCPDLTLTSTHETVDPKLTEFEQRVIIDSKPVLLKYEAGLVQVITRA
jgi:hypothetical protein